MDRQWVYVGTSTDGESRGVYRFLFDPNTGEAGPVELAAEAVNPSFLAVHPSRRFLYAVCGVPEFRGQRTGAVSAYAVETETGALTLLNQEPSGGLGPCHLTVDAAGCNLLTANYGSGSAAVLPLGGDGRVYPPSCVVQHVGGSVHPQRQEGPHAHSINLDPANRRALAADLGLDQILVYRLDGGRGLLTPNDPPSASLKPGAGPRHLAFHPNGRFVYVINELDSTVTAFSYEAETGTLWEVQTLSTLPDGFTGENYPAEVLVHPSGHFLYGSNRGHDSLALFRIQESTGRLSPTGHQPTGGKWPRNFALDPSGRWLICGNQHTSNAWIFQVDPESGALTPHRELPIPAPICFRFIPAVTRETLA